jgi:arabinofuranosyltransferase
MAQGLRRAARAAGNFALVLGPLLAFRWLYFGALVPNTMFAKASMVAELRAAPTLKAAYDQFMHSEGVGSVWAFFDAPGLAVWAFPAGLLLLRGARFRLMVLAGLCAFASLVDVLDRGDWMPFQRLVLPTFPLVAIGIGAGLRSVLFHPGQRLGRTALGSAAVTIAVAYVTASRIWPVDWQFEPAEPYRVSMGRALASVRRDTDVLATDMAGVIPYYSGIRTIDMLGLCDRYLATRGRALGTMGKMDTAYVVSKHPTFYQMNFPSGIHDIFNDPAFAADRGAYFVVDTPFVRTAKWRDKKILLVRKDRPDVEAVARAMGGELVDLRSMISGGRI